MFYLGFPLIFAFFLWLGTPPHLTQRISVFLCTCQMASKSVKWVMQSV